MWRAGIPLILLLPISSLAADGPPCPRPAPEYCSAGCEDLGAWVVEAFGSYDEAAAMLLALDPVERISAFIAQTPLGHVLVRRERISRPAIEPDPLAPHWKLETYGQILDAAADAHVEGGWVFSTNGSEAAVVRVWYDACPADPDERKRTVRR